jgi:hypothetical protein
VRLLLKPIKPFHQERKRRIEELPDQPALDDLSLAAVHRSSLLHHEPRPRTGLLPHGIKPQRRLASRFRQKTSVWRRRQ